MPTFCSCLVSASAVANVASTAPVLPLSSDRPPDKTPTVGATPSVLRSPAVFITRRARSSIDTPSSIPTGSKKNCRASEVESKAERHIWLAPVCCLSSCRVFRSLIVPRTAASIVPSTSISMSLRSGSDVTTTSCSASSILPTNTRSEKRFTSAAARNKEGLYSPTPMPTRLFDRTASRVNSFSISCPIVTTTASCFQYYKILDRPINPFASFCEARRSCELCVNMYLSCCLLYTSDAADEEDSVDLGGRRIIKKKKKKKKK